MPDKTIVSRSCVMEWAKKTVQNSALTHLQYLPRDDPKYWSEGPASRIKPAIVILRVYQSWPMYVMTEEVMHSSLTEA